MTDVSDVAISIVGEARFTHESDVEDGALASVQARILELSDAFEVIELEDPARSPADALALIQTAWKGLMMNPEFTRMTQTLPDDLLENAEDRVGLIPVEGQDAVDLAIGAVIVRVNPRALAKALRAVIEP